MTPVVGCNPDGSFHFGHPGYYRERAYCRGAERDRATFSELSGFSESHERKDLPVLRCYRDAGTGASRPVAASDGPTTTAGTLGGHLQLVLKIVAEEAGGICVYSAHFAG